jgi:predicted phage baseplate assembly protein
VRVASYLFGGGSRTNVAAGQIKELSAGSSRLNVRHEWPTRGGVDAETVTQAERRIPQFLTHRNRAVAAQDFRVLAENNPVNPVAKASVVAGFLPGSSINAVRENVPGAVSLFVLPPRAPALRQTPKATKGLLKDVFEYLLPRTLIGTELYVLSPEYVPLAVGVKLQVLDPETEQETLQAVQTALVRYLWPLAPGGALGRGWEMGVAVRGNELEAQVARVSGVRAVNGLSLFSKRDTGGWRRHAENEALALMKYQLPELLGVSVGTGGGQPELPGGIDPLSGGNGNGGVPAPVIPEVC